MSGPVEVDAIVLTSLRYGETSKIVRLATRELGVQSAIAKGALRPRSRFATALQPLSLGRGLLILSRRSDLHTLTAFELTHVPSGLGAALQRYAAASVLAEMMLRFAPAAQHAEAYDLLANALLDLESTPRDRAGSHGLRWLWRLVAVLGFEPALDSCVMDGTPISEEGPLAFSVLEGGALCPPCARTTAASFLPPADRSDLAALLAERAPIPELDPPHEAAHRRLLSRYVRAQLGGDAPLPALDFWQHELATDSQQPAADSQQP
jgi:DNA repair protein RecO (recombination protein O)